MSFPYGAGYEPTDYGVSKGASVRGMPGRTEANVTEQLKAGVGDGHWGNLGGGLIAMILSFIAGAITAILGGFATVIDAIFGTVNNSYIEDMPIITDHSQSITDLRDAIEQMVLQGLAIKFTSNNTYTPAPEVLSIDVIIIGAGAGGGAGRWDLLPSNRGGGAGGGGGGEIHASIPASLLPQTGGNFDPIPITVGAGGAGGASSTLPGQGGGNTSFGTFLTAGGGNGGQGGRVNARSLGGAGGAGMIPGGKGGDGSTSPAGGGTALPALPAGDSTSDYDLYGGGGGGGGGGMDYAGSGFVNASTGGIGGISPGGAFGQDGVAPSAIVATGGGGGGGGYNPFAGGDGAYPAGGAGGGWGAGGPGEAHEPGGKGGDGVLYVIERTS